MIPTNVSFTLPVRTKPMFYHPPLATTKGGALRLTIEKVDPVNNHNLTYRSGMVSSSLNFFFDTSHPVLLLDPIVVCTPTYVDAEYHLINLF